MRPVNDHWHTSIELGHFLDHCEHRGWLSVLERRLLTETRLEGWSCRDIAARNGRSADTIRHRIQRAMNRLRSAAKHRPF
jgi:IS30 family transposase